MLFANCSISGSNFVFVDLKQLSCEKTSVHMFKLSQKLKEEPMQFFLNI